MHIDIDVASTLNQCASESVHWFPSYDQKKKKGMSKRYEGEMFTRISLLRTQPPKVVLFCFLPHICALFCIAFMPCHRRKFPDDESNVLRVSIAQTSSTESHTETGGSRDSRGCGIKWRHYSATGEGVVVCLSITSPDIFCSHHKVTIATLYGRHCSYVATASNLTLFDQ